MTTDLRLFDVTFDATGDNTSNQYKAVFATSSDASGEVAVVATHGGKFVGVLQDKSTAAGIASLVRVAGITKMQAGASSGMEIEITEGLPLVCSSVGDAVPSSSAGEAVIGMSLEQLTTGSTGIIKVLLGLGFTT
jgi:hypothetical protein